MALTNTHPLYSVFLSDWTKMHDCYRGERIVKEKGTIYLPATPGQLIDGLNDGQKGYTNYLAYKLRARFPDFVSQAVEAMLGTMHRKPAVFELPDRMKTMLEKATIRGQSLQMLLRDINLQQLVMGRVGLLADVPDGLDATAVPYIATYDAPAILNWDDLRKSVLEMVVLDETAFVRSGLLDWENVEKFRILLLKDGVYQTAEFVGESVDDNALRTPSLAGRTLDRLPFVIINSKDIVPDPDDPPLLGLAELAVAVYRGEADYRQALFMQGQDTLVVVGGTGESETRMGAGAKIEVSIGGDAKYIGVSSLGLSEMRSALENDRTEAAEVGGRLLDTTGRKGESGESLRIRVSARTASLNQVALAGAEGLQSILRNIAEWMGLDPKSVKVTPNMDFANDTVDGTTLVEWMTAKNLGAPFSIKSIHALLKDRELTKLTFDEEMAEISSEPPVVQGGGDVDTTV
jgi:hypothetical protein